jgi:hypothetical protein
MWLSPKEMSPHLMKRRRGPNEGQALAASQMPDGERWTSWLRIYLHTTFLAAFQFKKLRIY